MWLPAGSADDRAAGGAGWFPRRELGSHPDGPEAKQEWGRAGGGRPGITRRIEVNGMVTWTESALGCDVHLADVNAELARHGPRQCGVASRRRNDRHMRLIFGLPFDHCGGNLEARGVKVSAGCRRWINGRRGEMGGRSWKEDGERV